MLPGHNHNLRHQGALFHVQTEDGGVKDPRVVTHLFQAGQLLHSERWGYGDLLGSLGLEEAQKIVRLRMMDQHKRVLKSVAQGAFDDAVRSRADQPAADEAPTIDAPLEELMARSASRANRPNSALPSKAKTSHQK